MRTYLWVDCFVLTVAYRWGGGLKKVKIIAYVICECSLSKVLLKLRRYPVKRIIKSRKKIYWTSAKHEMPNSVMKISCYLFVSQCSARSSHVVWIFRGCFLFKNDGKQIDTTNPARAHTQQYSTGSQGNDQIVFVCVESTF